MGLATLQLQAQDEPTILGAFKHNIEELDHSIDVKYRLDEQCRDNSKDAGRQFRRYVRWTKTEDRERLDAQGKGYDELAEMVCEIRDLESGRVWPVGFQRESKQPPLRNQFRPHPLWMLFCTVDNQMVIVGNVETIADKKAASFAYDKLVHDHTFQEEDRIVEVWASEKGDYLFELTASTSGALPDTVKHFRARKGNIISKKSKSEYRELCFPVSSTSIEWKEHGKLFVPSKVRMSRGWGEAWRVDQEWIFMDWRLGEEVDEKRLLFSSISGMSSRELHDDLYDLKYELDSLDPQ